jgi:tetraacyldisaccharide 4'-kinase
LSLAEIPYGAAVAYRNRQFDHGKRIHRVSVPVISVGNLTVGGTGKTPMVEWLAKWFRQRGVRIALISRGYGAAAGARNDEALELEQKLPDVPHLQNPDRVAAAETAIEEFESQLLLLDDAFQHRRIHRDLDLVMIDALEPFGYGHLLPRGLLREPLSSLRRADVIVLSRADAVDAARRAEIRNIVARYAPGATWIEVAHRPVALVSSDGRQTELPSLSDKQVVAFCGIGNPAGFRHTLKSCGFILSDFREFPDHRGYTPTDIEQLIAWSRPADAIICTDKDLVKIGVPTLGSVPLWALRIGLAIEVGCVELEGRLQMLLANGERGR